MDPAGSRRARGAAGGGRRPRHHPRDPRIAEASGLEPRWPRRRRITPRGSRRAPPGLAQAWFAARERWWGGAWGRGMPFFPGCRGGPVRRDDGTGGSRKPTRRTRIYRRGAGAMAAMAQMGHAQFYPRAGTAVGGAARASAARGAGGGDARRGGCARPSAAARHRRTRRRRAGARRREAKAGGHADPPRRRTGTPTPAEAVKEERGGGRRRPAPA